MARYGSGGTAPQEKNASGIRLLGVDPAFRGRGIGRALTEACIARAHGQVILHTTRAMEAAWHMHEGMGFRRSPDLDFLQKDLPVFGFRLRLTQRG
ncbi:GNAT family N-acetyltransferase [Deferrisoma sp.]